MNATTSISDEVHKSMRESRNGTIWFTRQSLRRLARLNGLNYDNLPIGGRLQFKLHCIEIAAFRIYNFRPASYYLEYKVIINL